MSGYQFASGLKGFQPLPENVDYGSPPFRMAYESMNQAALNSTPEAGTRRTRLSLSGCQGDPINCVVIAPENDVSPKPALVYIHGGAFVAGLSEITLKIASFYAINTGCKVFVPEYRSAFQVKYPVPVEDCYAAMKDLFCRREQLDIADDFLLCGDSSGACLAASVTMLARDRRDFPIRFQMLICPCLDHRLTGVSYTQYPHAAVSAHFVKWAWRNYLDGKEPEDGSYASPLYAADFRGLPKCHIEAEEYDCLRDDAAAYYEKLRAADVPAEYRMISGSYHGVEQEYNTEFVQGLLKERCEVLCSEIYR